MGNYFFNFTPIVVAIHKHPQQLAAIQAKEIEEIRIQQLLSPEEINVCSHFGCGRHLTLQESLCGNRCAQHSLPAPWVDVAKMLSF